MNFGSSRHPSLIVTAAVVVLDQLTKYAVMITPRLPQRPIQVIPGFFRLTYTTNTGATWGMLRGANDWLAALSAIMLAAIILMRRKLIGHTPAEYIGFSLLIGGLVGNLIDRVKLGHVVDFLDFYLGTWHFPAFNVADAAVCIGSALYILGELRTEKKRPATDSTAAGPAADAR